VPATLLPATTLASGCYHYMFYNCNNLVFIYMDLSWFTGKLGPHYMFANCKKITANTRYADIPEGWK
jgi:hypothetical protein